MKAIQMAIVKAEDVRFLIVFTVRFERPTSLERCPLMAAQSRHIHSQSVTPVGLVASTSL